MKLRSFWWLFFAVFVCLMFGCAANTATEGVAKQDQIQPASTPQKMIFNVSNQNGPKTMGPIFIWGGNSLPDAGATPASLPSDEEGARTFFDTMVSATDEGNPVFLGMRHGSLLNFTAYQQPWIDTSNTGATSPNMTGSLSSSQSPRTDQRVDPNLNLSVPVTGGAGTRVIVEGQAAKEAGQATSSSQADQHGDATQLTIEQRVARTEQAIQSIAEFLRELKQQTPPAPTTETSE